MNKKFICSFEVEVPDIRHAQELISDILTGHITSLQMTKLDLMCKDKNDPCIPYIDNWIEEAKVMQTTITVEEKK